MPPLRGMVSGPEGRLSAAQSLPAFEGNNGGKEEPARNNRTGMTTGQRWGKDGRENCNQTCWGSCQLWVTISPTALTGVKLSPHPEHRQEQRPPSVARALMDEGTEESLNAAWAIRESFLEEATGGNLSQKIAASQAKGV